VVRVDPAGASISRILAWEPILKSFQYINAARTAAIHPQMIAHHRLYLLSCLSVISCFAADMETGAVKHTDGGAYFRNTVPQVARLGDGKLLAVWAVFPKDRTVGKIAGAFSSDGGRTWGEPRILIHDVKTENGDPNILVDGN